MKKEKLKELANLRRQAKELEKQQDILVKKALRITKEGRDDGFTFDYVLNNFGTAKELLARFE